MPVAGTALLQQRPDATGFEIDDPQLPVPRAIRNEGQMPTVRRPRRVFVPPQGRQLANAARARVEHEHLQRPADIAVKYHGLPIWRPVRRIGRPRHPIVERCEQLLVGAVRRHHVKLRQPGSRGDKRDALPVGTERRGQVVGKAAHGQALQTAVVLDVDRCTGPCLPRSRD